MLDFIDSVEPLREKCVLEVACGTGEFLQMAAERDPHCCIGVDPSAEESRNESIAIHQALFDQEYSDWFRPQIDILINRHMIEHMAAPLEMLRLFAHALPQGGLFAFKCFPSMKY